MHILIIDFSGYAVDANMVTLIYISPKDTATLLCFEVILCWNYSSMYFFHCMQQLWTKLFYGYSGSNYNNNYHGKEIQWFSVQIDFPILKESFES